MALDPYEDPNDPGTDDLVQLREAYKALEKDVKEQRKRAEAAERKVAEGETLRKTGIAEAIFTSLQLNPKDAEFFLLKNPDAEITEEAVKSFAVERGWAAAQPPPTEEQEEERSAPPIAQVQGNLPPAQVLDLNSWKDLYKRDPSRALALAERGGADLPQEL